MTEPEQAVLRDLSDKITKLTAKFDAWTIEHRDQHAREHEQDILARSDPSQTRTGQLLTAQIEELADTVATHDKMQQRLVGALSLIMLLGLGTVMLVSLRVIGVVS
jgi:hypothetical protein